MAPDIQAEPIWPCEGYICDWGLFSQKERSKVKGQSLDLNTIFNSENTVTKDYFFTNIFLHNHNYHRVHSPVSGKISKLTRIPGSLVFLRPWFYPRGEASTPAFRNERLIIEMLDLRGRPLYLAMVGGFGVGSIEINSDISLGTFVTVGQELAKFNLGSTVCLATPFATQIEKYLDLVNVGQTSTHAP